MDIACILYLLLQGDNLALLYGLNEAYKTVGLMIQGGTKALVKTYTRLLQRCIKIKSLEEGKQLHVSIVKSGSGSDIVLQNTLLNMYAKCGSVSDARQFFDTMPEHDIISWTAIISAYAKRGQSEEAIHLFQQMQLEGLAPNKSIILSVLKACTSLADLEQGKQVHTIAIQQGSELDLSIGNTLVGMYVKCRDVEVARHVFERMHERDVVSWTAIIVGYAWKGHGEEALFLLEEMQREGIKPDRVTFVSILKVCTSLEWGKLVHSHIIKHGIESDVSVGNTLIGMYAKCGGLKDACQQFNTMLKRDVVSWNAMIAGYVQHGYVEEALTLYARMQRQSLKPDNVTFTNILKACAILADLERGKQIHAHAIRSNLELDVFVGTALVDMYAKCGSIKGAQQVFCKMHNKSVASWNAMITGYTQQGLYLEALKLFDQMQLEGMSPNNVTFVMILKACASITNLQAGKKVHAHITKAGFELNAFVGNTLVDMYAKCGRIQDAHNVFNGLHKKNVVSWTALISGYVHQGHGEEALSLFTQMQQEGVQPNNATFVSILKACAKLRALERGKQIHALIIESGFETDLFVESSLVDMYAKCKSLTDARKVFSRMYMRDLVAWNAMIGGYAQQRHHEDALELFIQMLQEGVKPDNITFISTLKACASLGAFDLGKQIHAQIIKNGFEHDVSVTNCLVGMYMKCGSIVEAQQVFNRMHGRDVVTWNVMIIGYTQQGYSEEAVVLLEQMHCEGMIPNNSTYVGLLKACISLKSLKKGKQIHAHIIKSGYERDIFVGSTLVDMYAKCGSIDDACNVFSRLHERDVVTWNVMISGLIQQGCYKEALTLFEQMQGEGIIANIITFASILKACASLTTLEWGKQIHAHIIKAGYEFDPSMKSALIDMYMKCGSMEDAHKEFNTMHVQDVTLWNVMIAGYSQNENGAEALKLYDRMLIKGVKADVATFVNILKACARLSDLQQGKRVHRHIIRSGFEMNVFVGSTLVDMYAKCGSLCDARQVFDRMLSHDVVIWNAMITGYVHQGHADEALLLFKQMQCESVEPNNVTYVSILKACTSLTALDLGKEIHVLLAYSGYESDLFVGSTLIEMYAKCGGIEEGRQVFNKMCKRDVVLWTVMIAGYAEQGYGEEALSLYEEMQWEGVKPNAITFISILSACRHAGLVDEGCHHFYSMSETFSITATMDHCACMVDLLGRAGQLDEAVDFIYKMHIQPGDMVWMPLLGACRIHGNLDLGRQAFECALGVGPKCPAAYMLLSNIYAAAGRGQGSKDEEGDGLSCPVRYVQYESGTCTGST